MNGEIYFYIEERISIIRSKFLSWNKDIKKRSRRDLFIFFSLIDSSIKIIFYSYFYFFGLINRASFSTIINITRISQIILRKWNKRTKRIIIFIILFRRRKDFSIFGRDFSIPTPETYNTIFISPRISESCRVNRRYAETVIHWVSNVTWKGDDFSSNNYNRRPVAWTSVNDHLPFPPSPSLAGR